MFDDGQATVLEQHRTRNERPSARCDACGSQNPAGYRYCHACGARTEGTLAYGAVVHLTLAAEWFGRCATTDVSTPVPREDMDAAPLQPANDALVAEPVASVGGLTIDTERRAMDMAWVEMLDGMTQSPAELAWDALAGEDVTAVWSTSSERAASDATVLLHTEVAAAPRAALLIQLAPDGYPGQGTPVAVELVGSGAAIDIGREGGGFGADDPYLEPWHARLSSHAEGLQLHEPGTRGGVWMRLAAPRWLRDGDRFRVGGQFLGFDASDGAGDRGRRVSGERGRIQLTADGERIGLAIAICGPTVLGRAGTDVVLMDDPFVSVAHCRLVPDGDGVQLLDLGSSNGTWVRLRCGDVIPFGAVMSIGQSVYRVEPVDP